MNTEPGKRILIVDDEPLSIAVVIDYLADAGYETKFVSSGAKAWEILNNTSESFDLILIDRIMPEMSGIELLVKIKEYPKLHHIPVIIETVKEDSEEYMKAIENGAADFIYKPLDKDFLLHVVREAIGSGEVRK